MPDFTIITAGFHYHKKLPSYRQKKISGSAAPEPPSDQAHPVWKSWIRPCLQLASCPLPNRSTKPITLSLSSTQRFLSCHSVSCSNSSKIADTLVGLRWRNPMFNMAPIVPGLRGTIAKSSFWSLNRGYVVRASNPNSEANLNLSKNEITAIDEVKPFLGKSGSVSFIGLTHQMVEEGKLESAAFNNSSGSLFWLLGPVALITSLVLPRVISILLGGLLMDDFLLEIFAVVFFELMFYAGLATFLYVTDQAQKPYAQSSANSWGLIKDFKGHLISDTITSCIKLFSPVLAAFLTWPIIGIPVLVSMTPFYVGCLAQIFFEDQVQKRKLSCWYLVPILFDIYRFFQLSRAGNLLNELMFSIMRVPASPGMMQMKNALADLMMFFQFLRVVCLWSLLTFLPRLYPSTTVVSDN